MADHPLRPATDRRLGGPLPHQLPNPTRAPPTAINLSPPGLTPAGVCGIGHSFPWLFPTAGQVPTRYSPVRHSSTGPKPGFSLDLHVLGMPPAFVLSQDQTLKLTSIPPLQAPPEQKPLPATPQARAWLDVRTNPAARSIPVHPHRLTRTHRAAHGRTTPSPRRRPRIPSS